MSNAVTTKKDNALAVQLKSWFAAPTVIEQVQKALPRGLTPERMLRQALTLSQTQYGLAECTPLSVLGGIIQAAELGLELSNVLGQAYLVPRWNGSKKCKEATFQVGYRGFYALMYRSNKVAAIEPRVVYANDNFAVRYGTNAGIDHTPAAGEPGEAVGYYVVVTTTAGGKDFEYMTALQCRQHRDKYSPLPTEANRLKHAAWHTSEEAMCLKTVARRIAKRSPLSVEVQEAAVLDEYQEQGIPLALKPALMELPQPEVPTKSDLLEQRLFGGGGDEENIPSVSEPAFVDG